MAIDTDVMRHLSRFGISGCHVRRSYIIGFSAQRWEVDDTLEPRETTLFFYNPTRPAGNRWAGRGLDNTTGIHGCAAFKPEERWVFLSDPGEVYVVGQGDDGYEKPVDEGRPNHFTAVKCIAGGYAYAVGVHRRIYRRQAPNRWVYLSDPKMASGPMDDAGFSDIDGFSDKELFACGDCGDLWTYDGKEWTREDVGTNSNLKKVCCGPDGVVYMITNAQELVIGNRSSWRVVHQDIGNQVLEEIVCFQSRVLVSTEDMVLEVLGDELVPAELGMPKMESTAHLAAGDGILVVAGSHEACMFDGEKWMKVFKYTPTN
ncbi:MAG: hypothetical protein JW955_15530 [Sedimentisphaerales bacterium]|nr:hypothetical protein [Sedimentisphaerales bacterium]